MKKILCVFIAVSCLVLPTLSQISSSFELRYFSKEQEAAGHSDFKGENEFFSTEQRVEFLDKYCDFASTWFLDSALDKQLNESSEIDRFLKSFKARPLPVSRKRILLDTWKSIGIREEEKTKSLDAWKAFDGVAIDNGALHFRKPNTRIDKDIDSLQWRFSLSWKAMTSKGRVPMSIALMENGRIIAEAGFHSNGNIFYTANGYDRMGESYIPGKWYDFKIEGDLVNDKYNLYINGNKSGDWVPLKATSLINKIQLSGGEGIMIDDLKGLKFDTTDCDPKHPYTIQPFILESFNPRASSENWYKAAYDDSSWKEDVLPIVHGGALEAGEDLFLRKKIKLGSVTKASLHIESLDPGGEVWINGNVVFVTHSTRPIQLDISEFLLPFKENTIGIRVYAYYNKGPLYHSPQDRNVGWFCGRAWIDLSEKISIRKVNVFTAELDKNALQHHRVIIENESDTSFSGMLVLDYYPWFPEEGSGKIASVELPFTVFARDTVHLLQNVIIKNPLPWKHDDPNLYRIHAKIVAKDKIIDDDMLTTGIRTVSQEGGVFRINNEPELLRGAQTMGFRMPIENNAKWNRCPPWSVLADELLACKKLGNALRIHVHAGGLYAHSVNDPRIAEMADQLGIMLIWPTSSWIREGEWGGIDFEAYPEYIQQVFNHPSIVMWEGANHPNKFAGKPLEYSNRFISRMYSTIASADSSRLISPASYNKHFAYRNDEGSIDQDGNEIIPCKEWTAPLIVRGNQDALTGYGAEWSNIRKWPDEYRKSFLDSPQRAYFNFEHEESIGMDNHALARGKPWYEMPSYENYYDIGSIGREFKLNEWRASQGWQAFSAYESMKWQRIHDIDGFSWCCLHGGPNSGTYRKPLIDALGHAKLSFYINKMVMQDVLAGSNNTDVVYHKKDKLTPLIFNLGKEGKVRLKILVKTIEGRLVDTREFPDILLEKGRTIKELPSFKPKFDDEGYYIIEYYVLSS